MAGDWVLVPACATGKYHLDDNAPCQDAVASLTWPGGFAAAVCDGAGSASHADLGARTMAQALVQSLANWAASSDTQNHSPHATLTQAVVHARQTLEAVAQQQDLALRDLACTVVACVSHEGQAWFLHVGDGLAAHRQGSGNYDVSAPCNGEFADQTWFITMDDWPDHLRVSALTNVGPDSLIGLMSDGAMPFVMDRSKSHFFEPFMAPVERHLRQCPEDQQASALLGVLEDPRTWTITADDKSLLLAMVRPTATT
jgi:hypothetical protein